jgi:GT2 family glycosyltransferase
VAEYLITGSIVLHNNERDVLMKAVSSFLSTSLSVRLFIVDNSKTDELKDIFTDGRCEYVHSEKNLGFGKAHNMALHKAIGLSSYHLILNPDVSFEPNTLEQLVTCLEKDRSIGLIMPKVLDNKSNIQYLCKRLPSPLVLVVRRLNVKWLNHVFHKSLSLYEMKDMNYLKPFEVSCISGCFMLFRTDVLKEVGVFDERFFLYMEDVDMCRRVANKFKVYYYPEVSIQHRHARESYRLNKFFIIHVLSAIKYFNKWGWIDKQQMSRQLKTDQ